ncbi:MAG: hypothetical protein ACREEM_08465 [Blastocatellia bacterium]
MKDNHKLDCAILFMIIGIRGGTGSGKTTVARRILENVSDEGGHNDVGIDLISGKIRTKLQKELSNQYRER